MPARIDLTGQTLGLWRVLRRDTARVGGGARWICRCECGHTTSVAGGSLRSGDSTRCQRCRLKGRRNRSLAYRPGDVVGRWTLVSYRPQDRRWVCRCACGATGLLQTGNLRNGHTTQCGSCRSRQAHESA